MTHGSKKRSHQYGVPRRSRTTQREEQRSQQLHKLDAYYHQVRAQILRYQSFTTGLFPRLSSDKEIGYVRDSTYCAVTLWVLSSAYRRLDDDRGRVYELGQAAVKTMRGILLAWMSQTRELESFKKNTAPENALHVKFNLKTGKPVVSTVDYGHLQIDAVALYLITLVQMISTGLQIIFNKHEVDFVQNLVFYIERSYRVPDFGMWEMGSRYNNGNTELNASSIGMAKAALESINGFNLYGNRGYSNSVIYVDIDAHNRNRTTFESLLPRESFSKNTDAALIPTLFYPCFASHNETVVSNTLTKLERKLSGKFGFKRFLRDGYGTVEHDESKRFYELSQTKEFDGIECQWPLFFCFMLINACIFDDPKSEKEYFEKLEKVVIENVKIGAVLPEYYFVEKTDLVAFRKNPSNKTMSSSYGLSRDGLFLWGQAVYLMAMMLHDKLIQIIDIDPSNRRMAASKRPRFFNRHSTFQGSQIEPVVQIVLVSESTRLQSMLSTYGIQTQTPHQVEPIQIWSPTDLVTVMSKLGENDELKLSGRPKRPCGVLGTSKIYRVFGETVLVFPLLFEVTDFYISFDPSFVIDDIKSDIAFVARRWKLAGRPTMCILLREANIGGDQFSAMLDLLVCLKNGFCDSTRVRVGRIQNLLTASCIEHLDFAGGIDDERPEIVPVQELCTTTGAIFTSLNDVAMANCVLITDAEFSIEPHKHKSNPEIIEMLNAASNTDVYTQSKLLHLLLQREGWNFEINDTSIRKRFDNLWRQAAIWKSWYVVRYCASLLEKVIDSLAPAITTILVRGKLVCIGLTGGDELQIDRPMNPTDITKALFRLCAENTPAAALEQELIVALAALIVEDEKIFNGMLRIKICWLIHALSLYMKLLKRSKELYELSPFGVKNLLRELLSQTHFQKFSPLERRQLNGCINRVPTNFYDRVWEILQRSPHGVVVAGKLLPNLPTLTDMTPYELNFSLLIDKLASTVKHPEYRQLMVELSTVVWEILHRNKELQFTKPLNIDELLREAFNMFKADKGLKTDDMTAFYELPAKTSNGTYPYIAKAIVNALLQPELSETEVQECTTM